MLKRANKIKKDGNYSNITLIQSKGQDLAFPNNSIDLVITSNVQLHIPPEDIKKSISEIVRISKNYILCVEYFEASQKENSEHCFLHDYPKLFEESGAKMIANKKILFEKQHMFLFKKEGNNGNHNKIKK